MHFGLTGPQGLYYGFGITNQHGGPLITVSYPTEPEARAAHNAFVTVLTTAVAVTTPGWTTITPADPLSREDRLRRVVILCSDFARNLAYRRAGCKRKEVWEAQPFWRTVSNNFIDHCVLEWCKLFAERDGKHCWKSIVSDPPAFEAALFRSVQIDAGGFEELARKMRHYRDKFLAHLDSEREMNVPELESAWKAVCFYHEYVLQNETASGDFYNLPKDPLHYYEVCMNEASKVYQRM
jgi:hypothetical protein